MNGNYILIFFIIILVGFLIYTLTMLENFETDVSSSTNAWGFSINNIDTAKTYITKFNENQLINYLKKNPDGTLTEEAKNRKIYIEKYFHPSSTDTKPSIPFPSDMEDVIMGIVGSDTLMGYSDELRDIIICAYLSKNFTESDPVNQWSIKNNINCNSFKILKGFTIPMPPILFMFYAFLTVTIGRYS